MSLRSARGDTLILYDEAGVSYEGNVGGTLWKKPFCFSFPPENSRSKDRNSRCRYQNNLPAAHTVFLNYPCQKSYGRKIPARNNRYGRKIPASNYLIRPENSAASNCRYGRKIPASNYQIRPENSASGKYRNGGKIPARNRLIVIASYIQGCSGAVVEHLVHNLKVGGLRLCSNSFPLHRRKIPVAQKSQQKI